MTPDSIPLEIRMAAMFVVGLITGGQVNRAIYRLAYYSRAIGPWSKPYQDAPPRKWFDRIPVIGWIALRRETPVHGDWFWLRPLLIELGLGIIFALLYRMEMAGGLLPEGSAAIAAKFPGALHAAYFAHIVLIALITVARFIDFDEQTIPHQITDIGALIALLFAALLPISRLPVLVPAGPAMGLTMDWLLFTSPHQWDATAKLSAAHHLPAYLHQTQGLVYGMLCYAGWCYAIWPKVVTMRFGAIKAVQLHFASIVRPPRLTKRPEGARQRLPDVQTFVMLGVLLTGLAGITVVWYWGGDHWESLFSALIGMAFGGGMIWAVRIIASMAMGVEAMGFGDVTLMAMIGAFFGWQATVLIFFLAPLTSLPIALGQYMVTRRHDIAFGPYLCAGALILLLWWGDIWTGWADGIFSLGWFIPQVGVTCLLVGGAVLFAYRLLKERFIPQESPGEK